MNTEAGSKKWRWAIVAALLFMFTEPLSIKLQIPSHDIRNAALALLGYTGVQGLADIGKEKAKVEAKNETRTINSDPDSDPSM